MRRIAAWFLIIVACVVFLLAAIASQIPAMQASLERLERAREDESFAVSKHHGSAIVDLRKPGTVMGEHVKIYGPAPMPMADSKIGIRCAVDHGDRGCPGYP